MRARSKFTPAILVCGFACVFAAAPASAADEGLVAEGARVFASAAGIGCRTCHGEFAEGDLGVGPYIRGAAEGTIRAAIEATNEMVVIRNAITDAEIRAVAAYLERLGSMQVVRTLAKRGRFLPDAISVRPGTAIQLVIQNAGFDAHTFRSDDMGIEELTIPARSAGSGEWRAPDAEGSYSLYCTDCKLKGQFLTVRVDRAAPAFRGASSAGAAAAGDGM